ncbi:unnamed protein product [Blepharisma stoltei]|uniref:Uncharacterized protein n=1 Tax=Blepharisma stoltei TaxID=1481888 RepID=A0AAU9IHI6_9CILI|nr:unnamed protein product [Blepharisma stoltei]
MSSANITQKSTFPLLMQNSNGAQLNYNNSSHIAKASRRIYPLNFSTCQSKQYSNAFRFADQGEPPKPINVSMNLSINLNEQSPKSRKSPDSPQKSFTYEWSEQSLSSTFKKPIKDVPILKHKDYLKEAYRPARAERLYSPNKIQITPRSAIVLYTSSPMISASLSPKRVHTLLKPLQKPRPLSITKDPASNISQYSPKLSKIDHSKQVDPALNLGEKIMRLRALINDPNLY